MTSVDPVEFLLIEDTPADIELTLRALKRAKFTNQIHVLRDGEEALDFIFGRGMSQHPKVILLDLKLPKIDGLEVLARIKGDERTRTIPVVVLTSSRESQDLEECYRLGANSYIVKPVNFEGFAAAVQQLGMYWLVLNQPPAGGLC